MDKIKANYNNTQRLFTEMLQSTGVRYEFFSDHMTDVFKKRWYNSFIPPKLQSYAKDHAFHYEIPGGYLWHVFSYGHLDCIKESSACKVFDAQSKEDCILFFSDENFSFKIKNNDSLTAELLNEFDEVFVTSSDFTWTYIHTHEKDCGPYFYQKGAQTKKDLIRSMMKRPALYVGKYRLDYFYHFLNGYFVSHSQTFPDSDWAIEYDLEKWLLVNESASIRGAASINSWSLFFVCFGVRDLAMSAFKRFLDGDALTERRTGDSTDLLKESPAHKISSARSLIEEQEASQKQGEAVSAQPNQADLSCPNQQNQQNQLNYPNKFNTLLNYIYSIIQAPVKEIKVYLFFTDYFMQLRFYFIPDEKQEEGLGDIQHKTQDGDKQKALRVEGSPWIDGVTLKDKDDYYNQLINLHAYAELLFEREYLNTMITISASSSGKIDILYERPHVTKRGWNGTLEPDQYKDEECFYNMHYKWSCTLKKPSLHVDDFFNAVDLVDWKKYNGPTYYDPEKLAKTLKRLASIALADTYASSGEEGIAQNRLANSALCNDLLFAVGNNHAGVYYPAAIEAIDFIIQVAINGNNGISRGSAIDVLIDLFAFWPSGQISSLSLSLEEMKSIVNEKIRAIRPQLLALAEWDLGNRMGIMELVECLDDNTTEA